MVRMRPLSWHLRNAQRMPLPPPSQETRPVDLGAPNMARHLAPKPRTALNSKSPAIRATGTAAAAGTAAAEKVGRATRPVLEATAAFFRTLVWQLSFGHYVTLAILGVILYCLYQTVAVLTQVVDLWIAIRSAFSWTTPAPPPTPPTSSWWPSWIAPTPPPPPPPPASTWWPSWLPW